MYIVFPEIALPTFTFLRSTILVANVGMIIDTPVMRTMNQLVDSLPSVISTS